jgi:hypothetical protein
MWEFNLLPSCSLTAFIDTSEMTGRTDFSMLPLTMRPRVTSILSERVEETRRSIASCLASATAIWVRLSSLIFASRESREPLMSFLTSPDTRVSILFRAASLISCETPEVLPLSALALDLERLPFLTLEDGSRIIVFENWAVFGGAEDSADVAFRLFFFPVPGVGTAEV